MCSWALILLSLMEKGWGISETEGVRERERQKNRSKIKDKVTREIEGERYRVFEATVVELPEKYDIETLDVVDASRWYHTSLLFTLMSQKPFLPIKENCIRAAKRTNTRNKIKIMRNF